MGGPFESNSGAGLTAPAARLVSVTASDTVDLPDGVCRGLLVGTAGNADIIDADGIARSTVPLQAGWNPLGVQRIKATNLTAASIWAAYDRQGGGITATTQLLYDGQRNCILLLTGRSDGGEQESDVLKLNVQELSKKPHRVKIKEIRFDVHGGSVELAWQADMPIPFAQLSGQDHLKLCDFGGVWNNAEQNVTGNILLSTYGFGGGSSYTIALTMTKHYG